MRVKLLKKLRKRFVWYLDPKYTCWCYYDRYTNKEDVADTWWPTNYTMNDLLILELLKKLGMEEYFVQSRKRIEHRNYIKYKIALRKKYEK